MSVVGGNFRTSPVCPRSASRRQERIWQNVPDVYFTLRADITDHEREVVRLGRRDARQQKDFVASSAPAPVPPAVQPRSACR